MSTSTSSTTDTPIRAIDVIRKKRDGAELSRAEIEAFVGGYTRGEVPDYQASAWLMATLLKGMTRTETAALTDTMLRSGEVLDFSDMPSRKVDKHSTGGVGDKTSLVLAPTPPVECLSTFCAGRSEKSSTSPERSIVSVSAAVSVRVIPFNNVAMSHADAW